MSSSVRIEVYKAAMLKEVSSGSSSSQYVRATLMPPDGSEKSVRTADNKREKHGVTNQWDEMLRLKASKVRVAP